ncbi:uncharacterized protein LOC101783654 isoform X1 [Setaria italica]|uniref:uncharacterized protein LOC101783654 isoform X1 n=1 Tax=Setaria italica TaxID=4555 RepID=UPI0003509E8B|nr:uncharacterized protein LOC101783654 isoform X1 [Setaria italica]
MVGWRFAALGDSKSLMLPSLQTGGTLVVPLQVGSLSAATSWMLPPSTSGFDSGSVSSLDWARSLIFFQRDKVDSQVPPTHSRSDRLIETHHPYTPYPLISYHALINGIHSHRSIEAQAQNVYHKKKTSRRVRACTESATTRIAHQSAATSVEPSATPIQVDLLLTIQDVNPLAASEAGSMVAYLLVEAIQATQLIPKQTVPQSADPRAKTAPPLNLQIEDAPNTSIIPLERPSAARFPEEAGSSTLPVITREPIIVESSPSDELPPPIPEMGAAILPTQAEEIHFKELRSPMMKKSHRAK